MKKYLIGMITILFFTAYYAVFVTNVNAQQFSLSISPPLTEVIIRPGSSVTIPYAIENKADPVILSTHVLPFEPQDTAGNIKLKPQLEGPIRFELERTDIKLSESFFLKTNESRKLLLNVRIPEETQEKDYYYTLLLESEPPPNKEGAVTIQAKPIVGSNILITVSRGDKIDIKGKIIYFDVVPRYKINIFGKTLKIFESGDKIPVVLIVENKGNNLLKPKGNITLKGGFGQKTDYKMSPENILSHSQRIINFSSSNKISGIFIGQYNLSAHVKFGENVQQLYASTSFMVIPLKIILILLIITVIIVFILKKIYYIYNNHRNGEYN